MIQILTILALLAVAPASADESAPPRRAPTLWKLHIEGEGRDYMVPVEVMRAWGLHAGQTVSIETARRVAIDLGADYSREILDKLEVLK